MFTGIIEHLGIIDSLKLHTGGGRLTINAPTVAPHLAVANSIAVNGCCLTVVALENGNFSADLSAETIRKTSMGEWKAGTRVNLEQPMTAGKEFGGHFVLGHVDTVGRVTRLDPEGENWWYGVEVPEGFVRSIVPQGSIAIDGISLTVARWHDRIAEVAIIPFTYEHTNVRDKKIGDAINLEGDILGKYVERYLGARSAAAKPASSLTVAELLEQGF
ncbi:MAG TPA: riboflavin synthase [Candidatus Acidoferrum sp.]|jgi:riboflavin synthase